MKNIKNYVFILGGFFTLIFGFLLILTLLNYFNIIGYKTVYILSFIFNILLYVASGFYLAKKSSRKGYLSGLLAGFTVSVLSIILSLIFNMSINFSQIIYYTVLILSSMFGGMIGINYSTKKEN